MGYRTDRRSIPIAERSSARFSFLVQDDDEKALAASALDSLKVTVYDRATGTVIRLALDILNANGGTVDGNGNGVWVTAQADTKAVGVPSGKEDGQSFEDHVALFQWTWTASGQQRGGNHQVWHRVMDLTKVT